MASRESYLSTGYIAWQTELCNALCTLSAFDLLSREGSSSSVDIFLNFFKPSGFFCGNQLALYKTDREKEIVIHANAKAAQSKDLRFGQITLRWFFNSKIDADNDAYTCKREVAQSRRRRYFKLTCNIQTSRHRVYTCICRMPIDLTP